MASSGVYFKFAALGTGVATQDHPGTRARPPATARHQPATRLSPEGVAEAVAATAASAESSKLDFLAS